MGALGLSILCNFQVSFCLKDSFIMCNSYSQGDGGVRSAQGWTLLMFWLWCPLVVVSCLSKWGTLSSFLLPYFPDLTIRIILSVINTTSFIVMIIAGQIAKSKFHGQDPTKWEPGDGGWSFHVAR